MMASLPSQRPPNTSLSLLLTILLVTRPTTVVSFSSGPQSPGNTVVPSCPPEAPVCQFELTVSPNITMMKWVMSPETNEPDVMLPVIFLGNNTMFAKRKDCSGQDPLTADDFDTLLTGDGSYKKVILINSQFPGTPIVVYKDQTVSVIVKNQMESEVITLHWHGLRQIGTPWMDGAGSVSHCPITPKQSFEYRFTADTVGTHWYHGHVRHGRVNGMFGPLTVLDRVTDDANTRRGADALPNFTGEFHMMVNELMEPEPDEVEQFMSAGLGFKGGWKGKSCAEKTAAPKLVDGSAAYWAPYDSILINGKGQRYRKSTGDTEKYFLPFETFHVREAGRYRFRVINAGLQMAFSISIDDHDLNIIASDGEDIKTIKVDKLVVHSGETWDFWIETLDPKSAGNYWIRTTSLEYVDVENPGEGLAILRYENAPKVQPRTEGKKCKTHQCLSVNCPYRAHHPMENVHCIPITSLRRPNPEPTLTPRDGCGFTEIMMSLYSSKAASINGISHQFHPVPPQIYPTQGSREVKCDDANCATEDMCYCTHQIDIPQNHIVQITFYGSLFKNSQFGSSHPMHLHGHKFQVVKMGWPVYNESDAQIIHGSEDISCGLTDGICKDPQWTNPSWSNGEIPDIVTEGALLKDTVIVPAGGYTTIRFKADNPGYWLLHCHMDLHSQMGMTVVLKVGEDKDMPPVPPHFPVCGDFDWSKEEFDERTTQVISQDVLERPQDTVSLPGNFSLQQYHMMTVILGSLIALTSLVVLSIVIKELRTARCCGGGRRKGLMVEIAGRDVPSSSSERTPLLLST